MRKTEFEFPEPADNYDFEVEGGNMKPLDLEGKPSEKSKVEVEVDDGLELEVYDDTPEEDRGRKKSDPPEDPSDEELADYSEKVQKRIKHFAKGYHDERREKEQAMRERDELERMVRLIKQENDELRGNYGKSQQLMIEQAKSALTAKMESAKNRLRDAYESGNTDEIIAAQEELSDAKIKFDKVANYKLPSTQERPVPQRDTDEVTQRRTETQPRPDPKAQAWAKENSWFGTDRELTGYALSYHQVLVGDGVDPNSDEYYEKLNSRMREKFPEKFDDGDDIEVEEKPRKKASVVAPVSRGTASKKVRLSQTQVRLAEKLGIPLEEYAKQVAIIEMRK